MKHVLCTLGGVMLGSVLFGQTGAALDFVKISQTSGSFNAQLANQGKFGFVSSQGNNKVISGAPFSGNGEIHLIELDADGHVATQSTVRAADFPLFEGVANAEFGSSSFSTGGNGSFDIAVGAPGFGPHGAVLALTEVDNGYSAEPIAIPADLQLPEARWGDHLAVHGNHYYAGLQSGAGKVVQFVINENLEMEVQLVFDENTPQLSAYLEAGDRFGTGIAIYDLNGDGIDDIICGAPGDDDGGANYGAVYQLYRNAEGGIDHVVKLSTGSGNFNGFLNSDDDFGLSIVALGDLDLDGNPDIAVGAPGDDDNNINVGAVWIIFLKEDGTMKRQRKINLSQGNFHMSGLGFDDHFGTRLSSIGDINGDGTIDLAVGAPQKDDGGSNRGAFYTVMIEYCVVPTAIFEYESNGPTVSFSIPGGEGFTYIWNFSDGGYSEAQNPVHTFTSNGTFDVCLTINGPCSGNFYCGPVEVYGVNTRSLDLPGLEVYPNPAREFVKIEAPKRIDSAMLTDLTGSRVWQGDIGAKSARIELTALPKGLYILTLNTAEGQIARKIQVL